MVPKLNYDCFQNVFEHLDQDTLFNCILVNRSWFKILIPYLWENPFSIVHRDGAANSKKLLKTIISMFPFDKWTEEKLNSCKYYKVTYHKYRKSIRDYLDYMEIFKSAEFHGFIDKCSRVPPWKYKNLKKIYDENERTWISKYDESSISSTLTNHIFNIIFRNCTKIRQFSLFNISNMTVQNNSFKNLSNLCYLEVGKPYYLGNIFRDCKKIKKIVIHFHGYNTRDRWLLLINFLKDQKELKAIHFSNYMSWNIRDNRYYNQLKPISEELLIQIHSIEELGMNGFILPCKQLNTLSNVKHLEITLWKWKPETVAAFDNGLCPLLEVLKFQGDLPPLDVLAKFIGKTKGHLQCFYIKNPNQNHYNHTQLLLKSIAKSCPKLNSLSTIINITKDLSFLKTLLISCNELKNFTLMSIDFMSQSLLQEQLRVMDENWGVVHEKCQYKRSKNINSIRFNKYQIKLKNNLFDH
ncbi:unnamed protein product [Rhizophagus irregularis]|uniref:F-box domain-containing protein n=3 Tax=Rhizophagus irregularis TaxID=588596 RepID=A0A915ZKD8_9GLOM|nr:unnamed protein product [Rhizophagus irregularis]CAB5380867.1 unnamed protein product [Rhizophagus irregularis]